jgi:hypothetical protein
MQTMEPVDGSGIKRDAPEPDKAVAHLVSWWQDEVLRAKKKWDTQFKQMKWGQKFVKGKQWPGQEDTDERYIANIVQRHIKRRTSQLYAKNPRFIFERKPKLDFAVWDGTQKMLQDTMASMQTAMQPAADPMMQMQQAQMAQQGQMLMQDIMTGMQRKQLAEMMASGEPVRGRGDGPRGMGGEGRMSPAAR